MGQIMYSVRIVQTFSVNQIYIYIYIYTHTHTHKHYFVHTFKPLSKIPIWLVLSVPSFPLHRFNS